MAAKVAETWITGSEIAEQRCRILGAGLGAGSREMQDLLSRVRERDNYLWRTYAEPLIDQHQNEWAAVSVYGAVITQPTASAAMADATGRFGAGNFVCGKLAAFRGRYLR